MLHTHTFNGLALVPVPVFPLVLALLLELLNIAAIGVAVELGPAGAVAIVLLEVVANPMRDFPRLGHRFVGVLAPL
ncbi:hypothetical protein DSL72_004142 [Monilinia vaccinii-corymbosi]|uniref:Uncharacterized protein n=1 Tax=Monilinia vaccinii-corymbosi TaxID=61207 RepID=A0A8A3P348_9HELO|nr:hypothetical protein DSL72_004142 [Monilinia vaccinii-corymbosi]